MYADDANLFLTHKDTSYILKMANLQLDINMANLSINSLFQINLN